MASARLSGYIQGRSTSPWGQSQNARQKVHRPRRARWQRRSRETGSTTIARCRVWLCVQTSAGAKAWVLRYRSGGRQRAFTIGSFSDWSVAAARDEARGLKRRIDQGDDPMGERHRTRVAATVADLVDVYVAEHLPRKQSSSAHEDNGMQRQHVLPKLGKLRIEAVTRADIDEFHRAISKKTPTRANRCLQLVSKMFAIAVEKEWRPDNPCRGIHQNREIKRERYLTADELARLMSVLSTHPNRSSANAAMLLLLTGSRRSKVLGAGWSEFDLRAGVWVKPASRNKSGKVHRVPLSCHAAELLAAMREKPPREEYLFPGRGVGGGRGGETQGVVTKFWKNVCADRKDVRLHDLRHTFASMLVSGGGSLELIGTLLGHSDPRTTLRYSHLSDAAPRQGVEVVGSIVADAGLVRGRHGR